MPAPPLAFDLTLSCGYNVTDLVITSQLGCIARGFTYVLPQSYFSFPLPDTLNTNLGSVATTSVVAFALVLLGLVQHASTLRYSYAEQVSADKMYALGEMHFWSVGVCFL